MGVERVDYCSDDEYEQALQEEAASWERSYQHSQEPDIVPCFRCNGQMYWEANEPEGNICPECREKEQGKS